MCDLISRQAAIDLIMETDPFWAEGMTRAIFEGIKALPSVQPEIVYCRECKNSPLKTWFNCPLAHLPFDGGRWCWKGERDEQSN